MLHSKICAWCKKPYQQRKVRSTYCSRACANKAIQVAKQGRSRDVQFGGRELPESMPTERRVEIVCAAINNYFTRVKNGEY